MQAREAAVRSKKAVDASTFSGGAKEGAEAETTVRRKKSAEVEKTTATEKMNGGLRCCSMLMRHVQKQK